MVKLPVRFNPSRLVSDTQLYSACVPVSQFKRFRECLEADTGMVKVKMRFRRVRDRISVEGDFVADGIMRCQRCLSRFTSVVTGHFDLTFVTDEAAAERLEDEFEPVILDDSGQIHIVDLLEDDLILELPMAPRHDDIKTCFELGYVEKKEYVERFSNDKEADSDIPRNNPFEILKDFTNKD